MDFMFSEERLRMRESMKDVCAKQIAPEAAALDQASPEASLDLIRERVQALADAGVLGLGFPDRQHEKGEDLLAAVFLLQELGAVCTSTALAVLGSVELCARALHEWGTPEMRLAHLPDLLAGRTLGAFGSMEPGAGLDAWKVETSAAAAGDGVSLSGKKLMVLNAPAAGVFVLPAIQGSDAGLFQVLPGVRGLEVSPPQAKMGCRGVPTADVTLTGCPAGKLAAPNGEEALARLRFYEHLLFAAVAEGVIRGAMVAAGVHARDHQAGGKPLGRHQEISFKLADAKVFQETACMLLYRAVWLMEERDPEAPVVASCAKVFAGESAVKAAGYAVQILGDAGCLAGSRAERFYRDAKLLEILGDPTEKHRMYIADSVLAS